MQGIRATKGLLVGGSLGGTKRLHRNNFGPPWNESSGGLRVGGDLEKDTCSKSHREVGWQNGNSECWNIDGRRPGGRMNLCGRRVCWDGDRGCPGGRISLCGIYGGD